LREASTAAEGLKLSSAVRAKWHPESGVAKGCWLFGVFHGADQLRGGAHNRKLLGMPVAAVWQQPTLGHQRSLEGFCGFATDFANVVSKLGSKVLYFPRYFLNLFCCCFAQTGDSTSSFGIAPCEYGGPGHGHFSQCVWRLRDGGWQVAS